MVTQKFFGLMKIKYILPVFLRMQNSIYKHVRSFKMFWYNWAERTPWNFLFQNIWWLVINTYITNHQYFKISRFSSKYIHSSFWIWVAKITTRIDIIWDQYLPNSIKSSTRQNRGTGVSTKVSPHTKMLKNWKNFLLVSKNKTELFDFLSQVVEEHNFPEGKSVFIIKGQEVISKNTDHEMETCTYEEEDTRIGPVHSIVR